MSCSWRWARRRHSEELGLDSIGLEGGGPVQVLDTMQVAGQEWLYAIGDVNGRALLTHMGKYQGASPRIGYSAAATSCASTGAARRRVIFTDPQIAAVGHTLASAREAGLDVRAVDAEFEETPGASLSVTARPGRRAS